MIQRRAFLMATAAALALPGSLGWAQKTAQARSSRIRLTGLRAPIDIVEDELGVPHVRAGSLHDAYFGQGYLVARDRLFQIDIDHRRDMGCMAEAFGAAFVAADKAARFLQLCDAFGIPVLMLCDTPGIMVGPAAEETALVRHAARLFVTGASVRVPLFISTNVFDAWTTDVMEQCPTSAL